MGSKAEDTKDIEALEKYDKLEWELFKLGARLVFRTGLPGVLEAVYHRTTQWVEVKGIGEFVGIGFSAKVNVSGGEFYLYDCVGSNLTLGTENELGKKDFKQKIGRLTTIFLKLPTVRHLRWMLESAQGNGVRNLENETWILDGWVLHEDRVGIFLTPICNSGLRCILRKSPELSWDSSTQAVDKLVKGYLVELVGKAYLQTQDEEQEG